MEENKKHSLLPSRSSESTLELKTNIHELKPRAQLLESLLALGDCIACE